MSNKNTEKFIHSYVRNCFITNAPAPYREPVNKRIFDKLNGKFTVIYCTEIEPDRLWKFDLEDYKKIFFKNIYH